MAKRSVLSPNAPGSNPLLSQAIVSNGFVFCSGSLGINPVTGTFVEGTTYDRAVQSIKNLAAVLGAAGSDLSKVVKVLIFLSKMDYVGDVNKAYAEFFTSEPKPARSCVTVAELPLGAELEIELVAEI